MKMDKVAESVKRTSSRILKFNANTKKTASRLKTVVEIQMRMKLLAQYWREYGEAYDVYEEKGFEEPEFDEESYYLAEGEYLVASCELETMLQVVNRGSASEIVDGTPVASLMVKPLDPPKFSGLLEDWVSFKDLFRSTIINNKSLSELHRLQYLRNVCQGKAAEVIKDIAVCAGNFEVAWTALTRRYENERLLVSRLIERLLDLPSMTNKECPVELAKLIDGTSQILRALAVLKRPTDEWDDMLVVLTTRKLDFTTRSAWEKSIGSSTVMPKYSELDEFLSGLLRSLEVMSTVPSRQAKTTTTTISAAPSTSRRFVRTHVATTGGCQPTCPVCSGTHSLPDCAKFLSKSVQERRQVVVNNQVCFNCLVSSNHLSRNCGSYVHCGVCKCHHHTLLHIPTEQTEARSNEHERRNPFKPRTVSSNVCVNVAVEVERATVLPTAWVTVTAENGRSVRLRALIDQGSEATLISRNATHQLGCTWRKSGVGITGVAGTSAGKSLGCAEVVVTASNGQQEGIAVKALILATITTQIPSHQLRRSNNPIITSLPLADEQYWQPGRVDVLLGAAHIPNLLLQGVRKVDGLVAQETIFGWMISGSVVSASVAPTDRSCRHITLESLLGRFWEQEETPTQPKLSAEDEECESKYNQTTTRAEDGRYIVELPFRQGDRELGDSRNAAIRRLSSLERKGSQYEQQWQTYKKFMETYLELGHMEIVPQEEIEKQPQCYLPHHAVFKPESTTTKLRVVFDASASTTNGKGLNNLLLTGPRIQDKLSTILLRWRMHRIALCADIEKMYRQIRVKDSHWDYQRIVWRDDHHESIKHFRLKTVTYGTACAPYLAVKTLQRLAEDEAERYPWASKVVKNDMYVDDCMTGADSEDEANVLKEELLQIMAAGGFRLLKWSSNSRHILQQLPTDHIECRAPLNIDDDESVKALGVRWHPQADEFSYKIHALKRSATVLTKRQVLSEIAQLFDPLGLLAPVIIVAKTLMQQLWLTGSGWDDKLPMEVNEKWQTFKDELVQIEKVRINRWCGYCKSQQTLQLHGFSDASQVAYAACVYARVQQEDGTVKVTLLAAKTKVAPIKQQSIPRLELNGAVLLTRLLDECLQSLGKMQTEVFSWTDSTVVLAWIHRHANVWPTFVANRVSEVQAKMDIIKWQHVAGVDNPADVASRGIMPSKIQEHKLWWNGPAWLHAGQDEWPQQRPLEVDENLLEKRKVKVCHTVKERKLYELAERFSSWRKLLRVTAYCRRVIRTNRREERSLSAEEIEAARLLWLRLMQTFEYGDVEAYCREGNLPRLKPFVDEQGLMRVGGRLQNANISFDEKHPIIITGRTNITKLIIIDAHHRVLHGGPQATIAQLHQRYWVVNGRRYVRALIHECVTCIKARPKTGQQLMGNLPSVRVTPSRPFTNTGIDYAGPIWSRTSKGRGHKATKSWIAVFVCFSTKAVHLELVSDLTTAAFLASFRRFTARRGHCENVFCDNGTNFVGANRELQAQLRRALKDETWIANLSNNGTKFHFAPPGSPHFNGLAESAVRMAKSSMVKVIGEQKLTFEEMATVLTQIEAAINSRPLCALPSDPNDFNVLTPGHFLVGQPLTAIPEPSLPDRLSSTNRWQLVQQITQQFWKRWSKEYVHQLQQRGRWTKECRNVQVDDIVVIQDDTLATNWRLGRVIATHPGTDGHVRVATMKTAGGIVKRTICKVCVLPIEM